MFLPPIYNQSGSTVFRLNLTYLVSNFDVRPSLFLSVPSICAMIISIEVLTLNSSFMDRKIAVMQVS